MKNINVVNFIKSLNEEDLKNRLFINTSLIKDVFYKMDNGKYLQIISGKYFPKITIYHTKQSLKEAGYKLRTLGLTDFNIIINNAYRNPDLLGYVECAFIDSSRYFRPFVLYGSVEKKLEVFRNIRESYGAEGTLKHVTYRGDSVWAQIYRQSSGGSITCKFYDYDTLEHLGYININNLNG